VVHRLGALLVMVGVLVLATQLAATPGGRRAAASLLGIASCQFLLGVGNVLFGLPLFVAVAHTAGAAYLLLCLVWVNVRLSRRSS
jgi:cytochrome c oxidase assembly protein subunit 15